MNAKETESLFESLGFVRPEVFLKPDPRGREYGVFEVMFIQNDIQVSHMKDGATEYTMHFYKPSDFSMWAKANT